MPHAATSLLRRALDGRPQLWPVVFRVEVLERYLADPACRVIRSDTAGRVRGPGGFTLDFGIAPDERSVHVPLGDLAARLPEVEREHWLAHVDAHLFSEAFAKMLMNPSSCADDGPIRPWRPRTG